MSNPTFRRWFAAAVVTSVASSVVLGLTPRVVVVGKAVPPTVVRVSAVAERALAPPSATARRDGVAAPTTTWSRTITECAPIHFTTVGLVWRQSGDAEVEVDLRWGTSDSLNEPTRVVADPDEAPDPNSQEASGVVGTMPVWTDGADCLSFRVKLPAGERLSDVRVAYLNTSGTAGGDSGDGEGLVGVAGGLVFGPESAHAAASRPRFITRSEWGADESLRNCGPEYADAVKMAYVHHTSGNNDYSRAEADDVVRGVYAYHTNVRGYCDIAYNFLVDRFGRLYEGRYGGMAQPVIGGHAMGFNTGSTAIAAMGNFVGYRPPARMVRAIKRALAWRLDVAFVRPTGWATMTSAGGSTTRYEEGERVRLRAISGHKDTGFTDCPGGRLYRRLDSIRKAALEIGLPKMWKPRQSRSRIEVGKDTVEYTAVLSQRLSWVIDIRNEEGLLVRRLSGRGDRIAATWGGRDELGVPAPKGRYTALIRASGKDGQVRRKQFTIRVAAPLP